MINKKVLILFILFTLLNNCSFDNKTGIWGDSAKEKKRISELEKEQREIIKIESVKSKYMVRDTKLVSERKNIKFNFNSYFPIKTINLMRGFIIAEEDNFEKIYIEKIFNAVWKDGLNMNDPIVIDKVLKNIDLNPETFLAKATDEKIKDRLRKLTDDALKKGVFGAPTFLVNKKIFWGQDRLSYAIDEAKK